MYKFDEKVRKSAITGLIIHGVFIVAAIIVAISMKNWAMGYWVAILPAIPTMLSFLTGKKSGHRTTYVFFDRDTFENVAFQYIFIMLILSLLICAFLGAPIIIYRIGKYIYYAFSKEKDINPKSV